MNEHRFLAPQTGTVLELSWHREKQPLKRRLRRAARTLLIGPDPSEFPRLAVDHDAFTETFHQLREDPEAAADGFRELGYDVIVVEPSSTKSNPTEADTR